MSVRKLLWMLAITGIFSLNVVANDLRAPMDLNSTAVLPKGIRNLHFRTMLIQGNDKFNQLGTAVPLADPFYKKITWNDLVDNKTDSENKELLEGYLKAKETEGKLKMTDKVGETTGDVHVEARPIVPILAYGVNEQLTMALAVPVIRYQANAATGFKFDHNIATVYGELVSDRKYSELNELSNKMVNPIRTKLNDYGYEPIKNQQGTMLGDVSLTAKYMAIKNDTNHLTTQLALTAPTGEGKSEDKLIAVGSEKIWSLGGALIGDFSPLADISLMAAGGYTYKLADKRTKRVPYLRDSKVTPDKEDNVKSKLGDEMFAQTGARYVATEGVTFSAGYTLQYKLADKYKGEKYAAERYEWMAANTTQRMETITVGLRLDTIQLYKSGKFKAPMDLSLNYSVPVRGKNVSRDPLAMLDASLFF